MTDTRDFRVGPPPAAAMLLFGTEAKVASQPEALVGFLRGLGPTIARVGLDHEVKLKRD